MDNGRGIPFGINAAKKEIWDRSNAILREENLIIKSYKTSGGLYGVGASVVNAPYEIYNSEYWLLVD